jgi:hypothetical protein
MKDPNTLQAIADYWHISPPLYEVGPLDLEEIQLLPCPEIHDYPDLEPVERIDLAAFFARLED